MAFYDSPEPEWRHRHYCPGCGRGSNWCECEDPTENEVECDECRYY